MARTIAFLGPLPPMRGGIARHSGEVVRALGDMENVEVHELAFRRLFPRFLYPGELEAIPGAPNRWLDTLNPLSWRKAAKELRRLKPDLLVIPAWTFFIAPLLGWIASRARRSGIRVTMIAHNITDHEGAAWKNRIMRYQLAQADSFIVHSAHLRDGLQAMFPGKPVAVAPHPAYGDFPEGEALPRRATLELLFFGYVRDYKGLDVLLDALEQLGATDFILTIAGEIWAGKEALRERIAAPPLTGKVELLDRYVDDAEVAPLFRRCDALIVPYRKATGSGVIAVAHNFGTRVIASDIAGLAEVVDTEAGDMLVPAGDASALAKAIAALGEKGEQTSTSKRVPPSWPAYCKALLEVSGFRN